jgi:hypothetical protein
MKLYFALGAAAVSFAVGANATNIDDASLRGTRDQDQDQSARSLQWKRQNYKKVPAWQTKLQTNDMECIPHPTASNEVLCVMRIDPATLGNGRTSTLNGCTSKKNTEDCFIATVTGPPPVNPTAAASVNSITMIGDLQAGRMDGGGSGGGRGVFQPVLEPYLPTPVNTLGPNTVAMGDACTASSQCKASSFCGKGTADQGTCMSYGSCNNADEDCRDPNNRVYAAPCENGETSSFVCKGYVCDRECI